MSRSAAFCGVGPATVSGTSTCALFSGRGPFSYAATFTDDGGRYDGSGGFFESGFSMEVGAVASAEGRASANARGVLGLMGLGALAGDTVMVRATGDDAEEAAKSVAEVLRTAE